MRSSCVVRRLNRGSHIDSLVRCNDYDWLRDARVDQFCTAQAVDVVWSPGRNPIDSGIVYVRGCFSRRRDWLYRILAAVLQTVRQTERLTTWAKPTSVSDFLCQSKIRPVLVLRKCCRTNVSTEAKYRSGRFLKRRLQAGSASSAVANGSIMDWRLA